MGSIHIKEKGQMKREINLKSTFGPFVLGGIINKKHIH